MATVQYYLGWKGLFMGTGIAGTGWGLAWYILYRDPIKHKHVGDEELDHIKRGGGIIDAPTTTGNNYMNNLKEVFSHRKLWGIYIGQFAINSSLWFFLTWFPTYLIKFRGLTLIETGFLGSIPFRLLPFAGILLSGFLSGFLHKEESIGNRSRKNARDYRILLTVFIVGANYVQSTSLIILFMAIAFFGNGMASITWVLVSYWLRKGMIGVTGGAFNHRKLSFDVRSFYHRIFLQEMVISLPP